MKLGTTELIFLLIIVLVIFGPKNLPKLAKMFGKTMNSFKKGMEDTDDSSDDDEKKSEKKAEKKSDKNDSDDEE